MRIVLRVGGTDLIKVLEFSTKAEAEAQLVQYLNDAAKNGVTPPTFYRVIMGDPDITLRKIRVKPGSEVTEVRTISATFEDDV